MNEIKPREFFRNPNEMIYLAVVIVVAVFLSLIFSGIQTFFCLCLGFVWPCYLFYGDGKPKYYMIFGKWRMYHGRYSFINLIKNLDNKLNERFNSSQHPYRASFFRILSPTLFFVILNGLFFSELQWYFVLLGALYFEWAYAYEKRRILEPWVRRFF